MARTPARVSAAETPLTIELAIRLSDGSFDTKVILPIDCDDAQRNRAIERWLKLAGEAMVLGVENLSAAFPTQEPTHDQSDMKIPEWAMEEVRNLQMRIHARQSTMPLSRHADIEQDSIARALLAAEQRGRKAGLEEAAILGARFVHDRLYKPRMPACSYHAGELAAAIRSLGEKT